MRHSCVLFFGILCCFLSTVIASYDTGYGVSHDNAYAASYAAPPVHHGQSHGHGHSAGSYYHYHVPLVGQQQQQHYPPYHHHPPSNDHSQYLWPLLLLLALPLLFLPLLPLLLLPIGLSLLALLAPGMMMMMMMMMMMPMMSPPSMRDSLASGRTASQMRSIGELVMNDMSLLVSKYTRSLDLDKCPERIACELGMALFPANATQAGTAKAFMNYIVEQALPKGKTRKIFRGYKEAFWSGSSNNNCTVYQCQPSFRIFEATSVDPKHSSQYFPAYLNGTISSNLYSPNTNYSDYYTNYQHQNGNLNYTYTKSDKKIAKAYYDYYANVNPSLQENEIKGSNTFFSQFGGTPVVKS